MARKSIEYVYTMYDWLTPEQQEVASVRINIKERELASRWTWCMKVPKDKTEPTRANAFVFKVIRNKSHDENEWFYIVLNMLSTVEQPLCEQISFLGS